MNNIKLSLTCYLYKVLINGKKILQENVFALFNDVSFAKGTFRRCYLGVIVNKNKGMVTTTDFPSGKCVIKKYINENYTIDCVSDFKSTFISYSCALYFNKVINIPNKLNFVLPYMTMDILNKTFAYVEPYLEGEYTKFSSNTGYENPQFNAYIPAFSHYSWLLYKGRMVILDVQGVFRNQKYYLTDPAVQSVNREYGSSDLGAIGLIKFVLCHKHNDICKNWKWVPKQFDGLLHICNANSIRRTSFAFEHSKNIEKYTPIYLELLKYVFP